MTMEVYENKFLGRLKYVGFIKYEKVKIWRFLSGLSSFYKEKIQYDEPKTLTETIRKDKYMYEKRKGKSLCKNLGRIRIKRSLIRERKDSNPLSTEIAPKKIIQTSMIRMNPREKTHWEKGEDHQSNVGDSKKITCTRISLIEKTK
jgi:hypothetical protein